MAIGEDSSDTRILLHGWNWDAIQIGQADHVDVDPAPSTTNWIAGANTSRTSGLTITVNNNGPGSVSSTLANTGQAPASLKGSSWQGVSFAGYRFLRLYLTCTLQGVEKFQTARLTLGSKYWDLQVKGSGYIDVDLCGPTSATATTDNQDSKWQYATVGPVTVTDGPLWGVSNVTNFQLSNLALGHVYTLSKVTLRRADHSSLTLLPGYRDWVQQVPVVTNQSNTSTTTYVRRYVDGDTDGRRSLEVMDAIWIHIAGGGGTISDNYTSVVIADLVSSLTTGSSDAYPTDGWTATDLRPMPSTGCPDTNGNYSLQTCYLNSSAPLIYLYGGGMFYDPRAQTWKYGFDLNVNAQTTLPAQVLFDTVSWYPGIGDVWQWAGSQYGGPLQLYAGKTLRAQAYGLVLDTNHKATPGIKVVVTKTSNSAFAGQGLSADVGEYKTGKPYPFGSGTYTVTAQAGNTPYPAVTEVFTARKRQRVCFSGVPVPTCCKLLFCSSDFYWPFGVQAGDGDRLPLEEWRRIPTVRDTGTQQTEPVTATTGTTTTTASTTSTKGNG